MSEADGTSWISELAIGPINDQVFVFDHYIICSFTFFMPFSIVVLFYKAGMQEDTFREQQFMHSYTTHAHVHIFTLTHKHTHAHTLSMPTLRVPLDSLQLFKTVEGARTATAKTNKCFPSHQRAPSKQWTKHEGPWLQDVIKYRCRSFSVKWLLTHKKKKCTVLSSTQWLLHMWCMPHDFQSRKKTTWNVGPTQKPPVEHICFQPYHNSPDEIWH